MSLVMNARIEQLDEICAIDREVLGDFSRSKQIRLAIQEKRCIIKQNEHGITGFLIFTNDFFEHSFISLVIVKNSERRRGVAASLIEAYVEIAITPKIFSSTNQSNTAMHQVFEKTGFIKSGIIENLDEGGSRNYLCKIKYIKYERSRRKISARPPNFFDYFFARITKKEGRRSSFSREGSFSTASKSGSGSNSFSIVKPCAINELMIVEIHR